jgi:hypothetical protein
MLVQVLAAAQRDPEAARKQLGQGRGGLRNNGRVIALPRRVDQAKRQRGGLQGRAQPGPGEAALALALAPGVKMIRAHRCAKARRFGKLHVAQQLARPVLLVRGVITHDRHEAPQYSPLWRIPS